LIFRHEFAKCRRAQFEPLERRTLLAASIQVVSVFGTDVNDNSTTPDENNGTDFGTAFVADTRPFRVFEVRNTSDTDDLVLGSLSVPAGFAVEQGLPDTLGPGASAFITLSLLDDAQATRSGTVSFSTNVVGSETFDFAVTGKLDARPVLSDEVHDNVASFSDSNQISRAEGGDIEGSPTQIVNNHLLRFTVPINQSSVSVSMSSTDNPFGANGDAQAVLIRDADSDGALDLAELNAPSGNLNNTPGGAASQQSFTLDSGTYFALLRVANFTVTNDAATPPTQTIDYALQVTIAAPGAADISVKFNGSDVSDGDPTPSSDVGTDFGSVQVNAAAPQRTFTVTNTSTIPVTLGQVSVPSGFEVVTNLPATLAPAATADFIIRLLTASAGTKTGTVSFSNNTQSKNPFDFVITGTVTPAPTPEIAVSLQGGGSLLDGQASAVDFGSVVQSAGGPTRTFVVTNSGNAALTLGAVSVPNGFGLSEGLSASLAPGASDTFTITLNSAAVGDKTGSISFPTNDSDENPFDLPILGSVVAVGGTQSPDITVFLEGGAPIAPDVNFGNSVQGQIGATRRFIVRNDGQAALSLTNVFVTNGFTITEPLTTTLAPGDSDGFTVSLSTAQTGPTTGSVSITSNDPDESQITIAVRGNVVAAGVTPDAELTVLINGQVVPSGTAIDFGSVMLSDPPVEREIVLRNDGTAPLVIGEPVLPSGFATTQGALPSATIPPGESLTLHIALSTAVSGSFEGPATIVNSDSDESAFILNLSGTVVAHNAASEVAVSNVIGKVPSVVIAGSRNARGIVSFTVTNTSPTVAFKGAVTYTVLASSDTLPGQADTTLHSVTRRLKLKAGASRNIKLKFKFPTDTPEGQKNILVTLSGPGVSALGVVGPTVSIEEPFVRLTGLVGSAPAGSLITFGRRATFLIPMQNAGNVPTSKTPVTYKLIVSKDGTEPNQVYDTLVLGRINLKPGTSKAQKLNVTFPPGAFAPGTYVLIVQLSNAALNQTNGQNVALISFTIA
jgi:hypothetical protein